MWANLKATPITHEAYQKYRRVLGKLSWMALTRPDLQFVVGFLARSQSNPDSRSEDCMRAVLRWILTLGDRVQRISANWVDYSPSSSLRVIDCFCDASWNLPSVSGAVICWQCNLLKSFSCKQKVVNCPVSFFKEPHLSKQPFSLSLLFLLPDITDPASDTTLLSDNSVPGFWRTCARKLRQLPSARPEPPPTPKPKP